MQKSVFECALSRANLELLVHRLEGAIKLEEDSLRIYRLREPRRRYLRTIGRQPRFNLEDPLVV